MLMGLRVQGRETMGTPFCRKMFYSSALLSVLTTSAIAQGAMNPVIAGGGMRPLARAAAMEYFAESIVVSTTVSAGVDGSMELPDAPSVVIAGNRNVHDVASIYGTSVGGSALGFFVDEFIGGFSQTLHLERR